MDKPLQIAINLLLKEISTKESERDQHYQKIRVAEKEISDLYTALNKIEGRTRRERNDKGKKRVNSNSSMKKEPKMTIKRGRLKQVNTISAYNKKATFRQKVVFAIKSLNRFVHNREIAEVLHSHDSVKSVDQYVRQLSKIAGRLKKEGAFEMYQVGGSVRNTFYGMAEWLSDNRQIFPGYEYNEKYLIGTKKEIA